MVVVSGVSKAVCLSDDKAGFSMIEQMVPDIMTQVLSLLDSSSLCSLSMTCPVMRKAANDDSLWKFLYHQDFTELRACVTQFNGWKAYYAATKTSLNVNSEFFNIIMEKSHRRMARYWLKSEHVTFHESGQLYTGRTAVMERLKYLLDSEEIKFDCDIFDVQVRVEPNWAWITMFTYPWVLSEGEGPMRITNVFELHNNRWFLVHHRCWRTCQSTGG